MTEEEAKQKWCPFARDAESNAAGYTTTNTTAKCIGSACMAWRWRTLTVWPDDPAKQPTAYEDETDGYCGLAGKP